MTVIFCSFMSKKLLLCRAWLSASITWVILKFWLLKLKILNNIRVVAIIPNIAGMIFLCGLGKCWCIV